MTRVGIGNASAPASSRRPRGRPLPAFIAGALAVLLGLVASTLLVRPAYACSCAERTTQQLLETADAVFAGTVTSAVADGDQVDLRFDVDRVYKGSVYADQAVGSPMQGGGCGFAAEAGSSWIVFARTDYAVIGGQTVSRLSTTACDGNIAGGRAPKELTRARAPLGGSSDRVEQTLVADVRLTRVLIGSGAVLAGLGIGVAAAVGLGWRRRRTG